MVCRFESDRWLLGAKLHTCKKPSQRHLMAKIRRNMMTQVPLWRTENPAINRQADNLEMVNPSPLCHGKRWRGHFYGECPAGRSGLEQLCEKDHLPLTNGPKSGDGQSPAGRVQGPRAEATRSILPSRQACCCRPSLPRSRGFLRNLPKRRSKCAGRKNDGCHNFWEYAILTLRWLGASGNGHRGILSRLKQPTGQQVLALQVRGLLGEPACRVV